MLSVCLLAFAITMDVQVAEPATPSESDGPPRAATARPRAEQFGQNMDLGRDFEPSTLSLPPTATTGRPNGLSVVTLLVSSGHVLPMLLVGPALSTAAEIVARQNLQLRWRLRKPKEKGSQVDCSKGAIEIPVEFVSNTVKEVNRTALARAFLHPSDRVRIEVLAARVRDLIRERSVLAPTILGYALAHEVGHVLQEIHAHSQAGVMRGSWTADDYNLMAKGRLTFSPIDTELIRLGVERKLRSCTLPVAN